MTDVLFAVFMDILNSPKTTAKVLAEKYNVSTRTIYRYINTLSAANIPIVTTTGKDGGIWIYKEFRIKANYLNSAELSMAISSIEQSLAIKESSEAKSACAKLKSLGKRAESGLDISADWLFVDSGPWGDVKTFKDKMTIFESAIKQTYIVSFDYISRKQEITARVTEPHSMVFKEGIWYIYAFCNMREDFRLFKVARMKNIVVLDRCFKRREFDIFSAPYNAKWYEEQNLIDIKLKVAENGIFDVEEWLGVESVSVSDGVCYATASLPNGDSLIYKLLSFGDRITVVSPTSLVREVNSICDRVMKNYKQ